MESEASEKLAVVN